MKFFFMLTTLFAFSNTVNAHSPSHKIFCEDSKYKNIVTADITNGLLVVNERNGRELARVEGLQVVVRSVGQNEIIRFINDGVDSDLPYIVFTARVNRTGDGTAKSFDDLAGGTTSYSCGVKYLNLY